MSINLLRQQLSPILSSKELLSKPEELSPYECDGLTAIRQRPLAVALPHCIEQIPRILKRCSELGLPVVTRGAGTGLSGGARPSENALLLVLARFHRVLEIDQENRLARVEPGTTNLAISQAVAHLGLYYAPDPSSQIACTIGGNVAENSGGVHCLKYGLTVHNILRLTMVLMDGTSLILGSHALDTPGYDLLAMAHGSEGMLGVITEITVRLLPKPAGSQVLLAAFDDLRAAGEAVRAILAAGIIPAGLEMMDRLAVGAAEDFVQAGYPTEAEAVLLCEIDGEHAERASQLKAVQNIVTQHGATETRISHDQQERDRLWAGRKGAFPAIGRISPDYYVMDGTIPRRKLGEVLARIATLSQEYQLPVANVFHAGDGNLHPLILYDANLPGALAKAEKFGNQILALCVQAGGTITGEHGVGVEKLDAMCSQFQPAELQCFHSLKEAFDPKGLLNPGKAIPSLHRCAELGAMHVHHGQLPHPELARF